MSGGAGKSTQTAELVFTSRNETGRDFRQIASDMDKARAAMDRQAVSSSVLFQRAAGGAAGLERRLTAATAAMGFGEVLRSSISEAAAMDRRMTRLAQNAEQTKGAMRGMKRELIDIANETGQSIESVIAGFETVVGQTGDYETAKKNIGLIAKMNQGLGADMTDTAQAARVLDDTLNFKNTKSMERAFDIFSAGTRIGAFEAKDFAKHMPILGQSMKQAGMTGERGLAMMVTALEQIRKVSPDSERAVLGFRDLIDKSFQPEVQEKFKAAGVNMLGELNKTQREGGDVLATIVSSVDAALSNLARANNIAEDQKLSLLPQLFGEVDSRRAAAGLLQYKGSFVANMREIINSQGEAMRRYQQVNKDSASSLQQLANKWQETKLQIGNTLIEVGILRGMDDFGKKVDETLKDLDRLGKSIERIKGNPLRIVTEPFQYGVSEMHKSIEDVSRRNLAEAEKNRDKARIKAPLADREVGQMRANEHEADAKSADARAAAAKKQGDEYRSQGAPISAAKEDEARARAIKDAEKSRFKAQRALTARSDTGDRYRAEAEREEDRAKRLRYQLRRGLNASRVFGNSDDEGRDILDKATSGVGMAMGAPGENLNPELIPPAPNGYRRMAPEIGAAPAPADATADRILAIRREVEEVQRAAREMEQARRAAETPRFDAYKREQEAAEAAKAAADQRVREQSNTRVMRPEAPAIAQPPAINRRPDHVPGALVDPYAPPKLKAQPSSYGEDDFRSMIHRSAFETDDGPSGSATERLQHDQVRVSEQTNAILNRLIALARYAKNTGIGEGEGAGGLGGDSGASSGSGGGGGSPGSDGRSASTGEMPQMGGGGDGAGGAAGGTVPGATPRSPFDGGQRQGGRDSRSSGGAPVDVPKGGGRNGPTTEQGKSNVASWMAYAQKPVDQGGLGLTKEQAHGMVAGMQGESGANLSAGAYNPNDRGRPSGGSMQWRAERLDALKRFAAARGDTSNNGMGSVETQQQYQRHEFLGSGGGTGGSERRAYEAVKGQETRQGALAQFVAKGERPQFPGPEIQKRSRYLYGHDNQGGETATPREPFTPGSAGPSPAGDPGSPEGLRIKGGQATAGGETEKGVFALARSAQDNLPGGVKHFAAFNDQYHAGTSSKHASGLAFDASLKDPSQSGNAAEAMREKLRAAGLSERDFKVIDEYTNPSARSTGGHIHTQFNNREAAQRYHQFAEGIRKQQEAVASAEKKSQGEAVKAIPRAPFTADSAGANPPIGQKATPADGTPVPPKPSAEFGPKPVAGRPEVTSDGPSSPGSRQGGTSMKADTSAMDAEADAIRKHRAEAEKPIRLRYQNDGMGRNNSADSVNLRRGTDASLRHQRQNSYADTGVA